MVAMSDAEQTANLEARITTAIPAVTFAKTSFLLFFLLRPFVRQLMVPFVSTISTKSLLNKIEPYILFIRNFNRPLIHDGYPPA